MWNCKLRLFHSKLLQDDALTSLIVWPLSQYQSCPHIVWSAISGSRAYLQPESQVYRMWPYMPLAAILSCWQIMMEAKSMHNHVTLYNQDQVKTCANIARSGNTVTVITTLPIHHLDKSSSVLVLVILFRIFDCSLYTCMPSNSILRSTKHGENFTSESEKLLDISIWRSGLSRFMLQ